MSWPGKGLGVLCLQLMGAEGACLLMPWMMLAPSKPKQLALLASWLWIRMLHLKNGSLSPRGKAKKRLEWQQQAYNHTHPWKFLHPGKPTCKQWWLAWRPSMPSYPLHFASIPCSHPGGHTRHLQSNAGQPIGSTEGQGVGHQSGWLPSQEAHYHSYTSG